MFNQFYIQLWLHIAGGECDLTHYSYALFPLFCSDLTFISRLLSCLCGWRRIIPLFLRWRPISANLPFSIRKS